METIKSKDGEMEWVVDRVDEDYDNEREYIYTVHCPECSYILEHPQSKIEDHCVCPKCAPKPAAVKTDDDGNCIAICNIGMVEFVRDYQEEHQSSERQAAKAFVAAVKAYLTDGDPVLDDISEESVRATVRRNTGKKPDSASSGADRPSEKNKTKRYSVAANPDSVNRFLDKHLPGWVLIQKT